MFAVSAVFIEFAGAKLNADRLKNIFKESRDFISGNITCRLEKMCRNIKNRNILQSICIKFVCFKKWVSITWLITYKIFG